jgi:PKHD-type hydroxylase
MSDYYVRKVLDESQIETIHELIHSRDSEWESGLRTFGKEEIHKKIKKNDEMIGPEEKTQKIRDIIFSGIDSDLKFFSYIAPSTSGVPMITRTLPGGMYRVHHDAPSNGDYSTTVFLSNPESYEGGELCLNTVNGPLKFKLPAGHAITYKTGIPHQVNPVTEGVRYVSVFWTTSKFKEPRIRKLWGDLKQVLFLLEDKHGYTPLPIIENIEDVESDPYFLINSLLNSIERDFNQNL